MKLYAQQRQICLALVVQYPFEICLTSLPAIVEQNGGCLATMPRRCYFLAFRRFQNKSIYHGLNRCVRRENHNIMSFSNSIDTVFVSKLQRTFEKSGLQLQSITFTISSKMVMLEHIQPKKGPTGGLDQEFGINFVEFPRAEI